MSQVSSGTAGGIGSYFMKWEQEDENGFMRVREGHFLVCMPTLIFTVTNERLYLAEADFINRADAEHMLKYLKDQRATRWGRDGIQFPRLLAELWGVVTDEQISQLCESMDLVPGDIDELFQRANAEWERIKDGLNERGVGHAKGKD